MSKIVRYLNAYDPAFQEGYLSRDRRYEETIRSDSIKIEIHESALSEKERLFSILYDVTAENANITKLQEMGGVHDMPPEDWPRITTATFDVDFSQKQATTDDTKRVYARIFNVRFPASS